MDDVAFLRPRDVHAQMVLLCALLERCCLLERAILALPAGYRAVLMLRELEEMSTAETADALGLTETNVKLRLQRAATGWWRA
ncbi:MAG: sigma factor-like helix-turn-helix DNA-binding protein [Acidobacteriota bacterium]